jgi:hypothetical protein
MPSTTDSALRCLLALIHLSFRFDPAAGKWVHSGDWLTRSDIEDACGLSDQGTRNGLGELESMGWVKADRHGRSHGYQLALEVPSQEFTYIPTALLENANRIGSGTELRVVLAVLRGTWGWTSKETDPESGRVQLAHNRWDQLSNRELAEATGRSETAIVQAAKALQGKWIERVRPGDGSHQYRFLPEAVEDGSGAPDTFCGDGANDLPPHRQNSDPPSSYKESSSKNKHGGSPKKDQPSPAAESELTGESAVRFPKKLPSDRVARNPSEGSNRTASQDASEANPQEADFSSLPPEKRPLAEKLQNVGVWTGRIAEVLNRFSTDRIRSNFDLYRCRAAEQTIRNPGAWLYQAITEGYALPHSSSHPKGGNQLENASSPNSQASNQGKPTAKSARTEKDSSLSKPDSNPSMLPEPGSKVSETLKRELIQAGLAAEEEFDKFHDFDDPDRKQHFYRIE